MYSRPQQPNAIYDVVSLVAGALLVLAFAPMQFSLLAIACPALLMLSWQNINAGRAALRGFLFGLGFFGFGASWLYIAIHIYGETAPPLACFFTGLFICYLSLFPAIQGYLLTRFVPHHHAMKWLLAFPASWTLFEMLRGWLFTGFPWLLLGHTQTNSSFAGFLPLVGIFGMSFIICFVSGLVVLYIDQRTKYPTAYVITAAAIYLTAWGMGHITWTQTQPKNYSVALVQGNIPDPLKWSPEYVTQTLKTYDTLTRAHLDQQLIVWPETALSINPELVPDFLTALKKATNKNKNAIVVGAPMKNKQGNYYNGAFIVGNGSGSYFKRNLVPFGEYVPFEKWFGKLMKWFSIPMSDYIAGDWQQPNMVADGLNIAVYICYEIAYSSTVLSDLPDANLLITINNDAPYGNSIAANQHLQIAQAQSLQTQRFQLVTSNTGLTAIVDPKGKVIARAPQFKQAVVTGNVRAMTGSTPWMHMGNTVLLLVMVALLALSVALNEDSYKK